jgi:hypothetical protein
VKAVRDAQTAVINQRAVLESNIDAGMDAIKNPGSDPVARKELADRLEGEWSTHKSPYQILQIKINDL